jgi:hypothetical protein
MCKKFNWTILKYSIFTLIDLVLSISGLISVLTVYALYRNTLIFYFMLYNIIISLFNMLHFIKVFKDILDDGLNDVIYVKIKVILMIASFIWGIIILQHSEIILFYQENYPKIYTSFVNYFIMSSISILDIVYKIINFIYLKNKKKSTNTDYEILLKINDELNDELNKTIIEIPQIQ